MATIVALITTAIAALTAHQPATPASVSPGPVISTPDPGAMPSVATRTVWSTAYCETGQMFNGERTYFGAVAMAEPIGSRWRVLTGLFAGVVFTASDRYGWGTDFDIALPGQCDRARAYGRERIVIAPA